MRRVALGAATFAALQACAHRSSVADLARRDGRGKLEGRHLRIVTFDPEAATRRAVTLEVTRFDEPYVEGTVFAEEAMVDGEWDVRRVDEHLEKFDLRSVERVDRVASGGRVAGYGCATLGVMGLLGLVTYAIVIVPAQTQVVEGRPLRVSGGRLAFPALLTFDGVRRPRRREAGTHPREAGEIGDEWLRAARAEAASVPAFIRMAAELRAVGADAALADGAIASAIQEVRHARLCFDEAASWAGRAFDGAPVEAPPRWESREQAALATLAVEAWEDGCLGEGTAAAAARLTSKEARSEAIALGRARIADDEAAHAELAWRVLEWCWREGGTEVRDAVVRSSGTPRSEPPSRESGLDEEWMRGRGVPSAATRKAAAEQTEALARTRLRKLVEHSRA